MWEQLRVFHIVIFIFLTSGLFGIAKMQSPILNYREISQIGRGTAVGIGWNSSGDRLAVGGSDGIWLYTPNFEDISHFHEQVGAINILVWSPDGSKLAGAGRGFIVQIYDTHTGSLIKTLPQPGGIYAIAWSPDGAKIAVSTRTSDGYQINIWVVADNKLLLVLPDTERIMLK